MWIPLVVLAAAVLMIACERRWPGRRFPVVPGWLGRAVALNSVQAGVVLLTGRVLDTWIADQQLWSAASLGTIGGGAVGYLALTFVYYWWHRARHAVPWLWRWVHQLHHSPQRIEIVTSFYKHPLEIGLNGVLSSAVLYLAVGVTPAAATVAVLVCGLAELVYHWNVRTPWWLGYVFQRPEMHCVHHQQGRHAGNYSDLPLWDMLFGTFDNPREFEAHCGFAEHRERRLWAMLRGVDVNRPATRPRAVAGRRAAVVVLVLGLSQMGARVLGLPRLAGAAAATGASPAPKVFTAVDGYEGFSTRFSIVYREPDGTPQRVELTPAVYAGVLGPYNRRNAYGAALAYWPVASNDPRLRPMFEAAARHALCGRRPLLAELGVDPQRVVDPVIVVFGTRPGTPADRAPAMEMHCR